MRTVLLIKSAGMIGLTFTQVFKIHAVGTLYNFVSASYLAILFIFDRFYRADYARSRKEVGTGLGLAIVTMIFDIHHYDIDIQSKVDKGTTVVVKTSK